MERGRTGRALGIALVGLLLIFTGTLAGWAFLQQVRVPSELFEFKFQRVGQHASGPGNYEVTSKQPGACGPYPLRLEDIARAVQKIGGERGFHYLADCSTLYMVAHEAQALRDSPLIQFGIQEIGTDALRIFGNRTLISGEATEPSGMFIDVTGGAVIGQRTNRGYAEIYFGGIGPIFKCEGGTYPWHANIHHPARDTFFELEITDRDTENTSGTFSCLARNKDDANDPRLLIILDGLFSMKNALD